MPILDIFKRKGPSKREKKCYNSLVNDKKIDAGDVCPGKKGNEKRYCFMQKECFNCWYNQ